MARPAKNNLDYFSHDNNMRNDPKLKAVRSKFGLAGYAVYVMLLETLSESELLVIKVNDITIELLAGDIGIDPVQLNDMIEYFKRINLLQLENNYLYCKQLDKRAHVVFEKRTRFLHDLRNENGISVTESTHSKVKNSKGK